MAIYHCSLGWDRNRERGDYEILGIWRDALTAMQGVMCDVMCDVMCSARQTALEKANR